MYKLIRSSLSQAVIEGRIKKNVSDRVKLPQKNKKDIEPLTELEATTFLKYIQCNRLYAAFVLELTTGLRCSELLALKWANIDFEGNYLTIKSALIRKRIGGGFYEGETKTEKSKRKIFIYPLITEELRKHQERQKLERQELGANYIDKDLIFCHENGEYINPGTFYSIFVRQLPRAGIRHVTFHTLRYSVATILVQKGVHLKTIQELLGHTKIATTGDIYSHVMNEVKQDAANMLINLLPLEPSEKNLH